MFYHTKKHTIDITTGTITNNETNEVETITRRQLQILSYLYSKRGSWASRGQIVENAFGYEYAGNEDQITQQISKINQRLGEDENIIENKHGTGLYRLVFREEKPSRYSSYDGLKKCFAYCPDAKYVDEYTQMGRTLFTEMEASDYFRTMIKKGIKFRIMINSPDAVSVSYKDEGLDYLDKYYNLATDDLIKDNVTVKVSGETFHERLFLVYRGNCFSDGVADVRKYHYSVSLSQSASQIIRSDQSDFKLYVNEFQRLWNSAIPIDEYFKTCKLKKETWEYRLIEAFEKKEQHDYASFIHILQNLSDEGYYVAMNRLAVCYLTGQYIEKDCKTGIELLKEAGKNGNRKSIFGLGICYWYGLANLPQNYAEAVSLFQKSADSEYPDGDSCYFLYLAYRNGCGVKKNNDKADYYRQIAQKSGVTAENVYEFGEELQQKQK